MPAGFIEQFATRLKACVSNIFSGSDGQGKQPGFTHQGPGQLNTSNENAPSPKARAGKRIERMKGTAEYLSAG